MIEFPKFEDEPIVFLEGGQGLHDTEQVLASTCFERYLEHYVLDNLYEHPEKVRAIEFLKPKSIVMGTTGVYRDKIIKVIEQFQMADYIPDKLYICMGEELSIIGDVIEWAMKKKPSLKVYRVYPLSPHFDIKEAPCLDITEDFQ